MRYIQAQTAQPRRRPFRKLLLFIVLLSALTGGVVYARGRTTQTKHKTPTIAKPITAAASSPSSPISSPSQQTTSASPKTVAPASPPSQCDGNTLAHVVLVSLSQQYLWACAGTTLVEDSAVTTGASAITNVDDATPTGTWTIQSKQTDRHLTGSDANGSWDDFVQYWIPFNGDYGFHDASWQTIPFGSQAYKTEGSHGCIHLPLATIVWLYNWAPVGTTVTITS